MNVKSVIAQAPGRINIIGEHTDYTNGWVLPAAINKKVTFKLSRNGTNEKVNIYAKDYDERYSFNLNQYSALPGGWQNYIMGVVHEVQKLGGVLSGFDGEFEGDIPIGGGMSSSAALESSLAVGLNELFDLGLDAMELIKIGQMAEHNFVGIKCGIMDQFASVMGKKNHVILLDTGTLDYQYIPFELGDYQLLLLNSNVSHTLASSEYNTRREECLEATELLQTKFPQIDSLRDVTLEMLEQFIDEMPAKIYSRSRHVISENRRVHLATNALLNRDFKTLGDALYASHSSLKNDYEVSCVELDFLVELGLDKEHVLGSRIMGGGFGGCTINIVHERYVDAFIDFASREYFDRFRIDPTPYRLTIEAGAGIVK